MEKLKIVIKKYWKIYLAALVISAVCDLIGTVKLNIGVGTLNGHFFRCKSCKTGFSGPCIASSGIRKSWNDSFIYASRIIAWFKEGIYWCMLLN